VSIKDLSIYLSARLLYIILYIKKLQTIYLMLYKRQIKNCKNQKYKHELYALAYIFIWLI